MVCTRDCNVVIDCVFQHHKECVNSSNWIEILSDFIGSVPTKSEFIGSTSNMVSFKAIMKCL